MGAQETNPGERRGRSGGRRALRVVGWNAALLAAGLVLIAAAGESYLRAAGWFGASRIPRQFVPDVGYIYSPGAEIRYTNNVDFWTVSRTNSLGFNDREPVSPARAAAGCHVAAIGDSFVDAREVPIADKFHVRLEALARQELPHLDVTTSAFGHFEFAPVNELAFYDHYARHLRPKLLVLVLTTNDLWGNSSRLRGLEGGWDPDHLPFVSVRRQADGALKLLPPDPTYVTREARVRRAVYMLDSSYLLAWSRHHFAQRWPHLWTTGVKTVLGTPRREPSTIPPLTEWPATIRARELPPAFEEALPLLGFALDQFVERTRRDGTALVILAAYNMGGRDDRAFGRLHALAGARDIPVINQHDFIVGRGGRVRDARWPHDGHWSPAGHQWAAEALLEHLRRNPEICGPRA